MAQLRSRRCPPLAIRTGLAEDLERLYVEKSDRLLIVGGGARNPDAADTVHEAVVRALEADQRQSILNPTGFLLMVTRNLKITRFRAQAQAATRAFHEGEDFTENAPGPEQALLARERLRQVVKVVETMPQRRREAFLLHRIDGLSYAQIARRMKVSLKAVEKHISLAMAQLHREMGPPP